MMTDKVLEVRGKLTKTVDKIFSKYQDLVETFKEHLLELGLILTRRHVSVLFDTTSLDQVSSM